MTWQYREMRRFWALYKLGALTAREAINASREAAGYGPLEAGRDDMSFYAGGFDMMEYLYEVRKITNGWILRVTTLGPLRKAHEASEREFSFPTLADALETLKVIEASA